MSNYMYEAVDAAGLRSKGSLEVLDQSEALRRIKEMGLFPTMVRPVTPPPVRPQPVARRKQRRLSLGLAGGRVKPAALTVFTRQLATLVDVGMPLLRGLRLLHQQEGQPALKQVIAEIVGEQTGALPDMLLKIADTGDEEVDNAVTAMTSLLEPVMIVFLAVVVGSIVIAMFLPLISLIAGATNDGDGGHGRE